MLEKVIVVLMAIVFFGAVVGGTFAINGLDNGNGVWFLIGVALIILSAFSFGTVLVLSITEDESYGNVY